GGAVERAAAAVADAPAVLAAAHRVAGDRRAVGRGGDAVHAAGAQRRARRAVGRGAAAGPPAAATGRARAAVAARQRAAAAVADGAAVARGARDAGERHAVGGRADARRADLPRRAAAAVDLQP